MKLNSIFVSALCIPILLFNSTKQSDAIWWHKSRSTLSKVMACCLMTPSHYLSKYWLIIDEVFYNPFAGYFAGIVQHVGTWYEIENNQFKIAALQKNVPRIGPCVKWTSLIYRHEMFYLLGNSHRDTSFWLVGFGIVEGMGIWEKPANDRVELDMLWRHIGNLLYNIRKTIHKTECFESMGAFHYMLEL